MTLFLRYSKKITNSSFILVVRKFQIFKKKGKKHGLKWFQMAQNNSLKCILNTTYFFFWKKVWKMTQFKPPSSVQFSTLFFFFFDGFPIRGQFCHFHKNCNKHQFWRGSSCPKTIVSWMFCPFVHFFLDRQKISLKNTVFLPSLRSIIGWLFSANVSTKVLRKN